MNTLRCGPRLCVTLSQSNPLYQRIDVIKSRRYIASKAAAGDAESEDPSATPTPSSSSSSNPMTYAIPAGVPPAGAVFVLAGFLKILIMCFPFSVMAISMYFQGRAELGTWAAVKMLPLALGILALAKHLSDNKELMAKKWFHRAVAIGGIVALIASRLIFARPKPSPLDPYIRAAHEHKMAQMAELQRRNEVNQGRLMNQPTEETREALKSRWRRFK